VKGCHRRTNRAATTRAFPLQMQLLLRRSTTRLDLQRAAAAVRSRTEDLKVERLHIASWWSAKLVPYGEAPAGRRRQDLHALRGFVPWTAGTPAVIPGAAPPRPRLGRGRRITLIIIMKGNFTGVGLIFFIK
jgi:hypothetical protein